MIGYQKNPLKVMQNVEKTKVCKNILHAKIVRVNMKAQREREVGHAKK